MERLDLWFKSGLIALGTVFSVFVETFGLFVVILIVMQAIDYVTGLMVGAVERKLSSRTGFRGLAKKMYVLILVGTVYFLELNIFGTVYLGDGVAIAYAVMELISITENGGKLGAPIPPQVSNLIEMLQNRKDGK